jgi:hypothetical protein
VKSAGEKNAEPMQKAHKDEGVCAPVVKVSDQPSEQNVLLKNKDGLIGLLRKGLVNKLQKNPCPQKQGNQHNRHPPQAPGEGPLKGFFRDASRAEMKNQRVQEPSIALTLLSCPCCAWKNGKANAL